MKGIGGHKRSIFVVGPGSAVLTFWMALSLGGCANLEPVTAGRTIRGFPADQAVVMVPRAVVGRQQDVRVDMPPTTCTPMAANDHGVFFRAEKPVFVKSWVLIGGRMIDGGVFVPDDPNKPCKPFYVYQGKPVPMHKTDEPTRVTLVETSTRRRVELPLE